MDDAVIPGVFGVDVFPERDVVLDNRLEGEVTAVGSGSGFDRRGYQHADNQDGKTPEDTDDGGTGCWGVSIHTR